MPLYNLDDDEDQGSVIDLDGGLIDLDAAAAPARAAVPPPPPGPESVGLLSKISSGIGAVAGSPTRALEIIHQDPEMVRQLQHIGFNIRQWENAPRLGQGGPKLQAAPPDVGLLGKPGRFVDWLSSFGLEAEAELRKGLQDAGVATRDSAAVDLQKDRAHRLRGGYSTLGREVREATPKGGHVSAVLRAVSGAGTDVLRDPLSWGVVGLLRRGGVAGKALTTAVDAAFAIASGKEVPAALQHIADIYYRDGGWSPDATEAFVDYFLAAGGTYLGAKGAKRGVKEVRAATELSPIKRQAEAFIKQHGEFLDPKLQELLRGDPELRLKVQAELGKERVGKALDDFVGDEVQGPPAPPPGPEGPLEGPLDAAEVASHSGEYAVHELPYLPEIVREPFYAEMKKAASAYEDAIGRAGVGRDPNHPLWAEFEGELGAEDIQKYVDRFAERVPEEVRPQVAADMRRLILEREQGWQFKRQIQDFRDNAIAQGRTPWKVFDDAKTGAKVEIWTADGNPGEAIYTVATPDGDVTAGATSITKERWVKDPSGKQEYVRGGSEIGSVFGGDKLMGLPDYTLPDGTRASGSGPVYRALKEHGVESSTETTGPGFRAQVAGAKKGLDVRGAVSEVLQYADRSAGAPPEAGRGVQGVGGPEGAAAEGAAAAAGPGGQVLPPREPGGGTTPELPLDPRAPAGEVAAPTPEPALSPEAGVLRIGRPVPYEDWHRARYGEASPVPPPGSYQRAVHQAETTGTLPAQGSGEAGVPLPAVGQTLSQALRAGPRTAAELQAVLSAAHPGIDAQAAPLALQELGLVRLIEDPTYRSGAPFPPGAIIRPADPSAPNLVREALGDVPTAGTAGGERVYSGVELTERGMDPGSWSARGAAKGLRGEAPPTPERFEELAAARRAAEAGPSIWSQIREATSTQALKTKFYNKFEAVHRLADAVQTWLQENQPDALVERLGAKDWRLPTPAEVRLKLGEILAATGARAEVLVGRDLQRVLDRWTLAGPRVQEVSRNLIDLLAWRRNLDVVERRAEALREQAAYHEAAMKHRRRVSSAEGHTQRRRVEVDTDARIREAVDAGDAKLVRQLRKEQEARYQKTIAKTPWISPEQRKTLAQKHAKASHIREHFKRLREAEARLGGRYYEARKATPGDPNAPRYPSEVGRDPTQLRALAGRFKEAKGELKDLEKRIAQGKIVPLNYTRGDVEAGLAKIREGLTPDEWDAANRIADELFAFNSKVLDYYKQNGMISEAIYQELLERGDHYVPLTRLRADMLDAEGGWGVSSMLSLPMRKYLQRFEGSELATVDPFEASAIAAMRAVSDVSRNQAAATVIAMHELAPEVTEFRKLKEGDRLGADEGVITLWKDGQKERWAVPAEIATVQAAAKDPHVAGMTLRFFQNVLRFGTTGGNIAFSVYNIPRDLHDTINLARFAQHIPWGMRHAYVTAAWVDTLVRDVLPKSENYWQALWDGAVVTRQRSLTPGAFAPELRGERRLIDRMIKVLSTPTELGEVTTKVMGHKLEQGKTPGWLPEFGVKKAALSRGEAAFQVREYVGTPNASRRGTYSDDLNTLFMFLNINIQGKARMWQRLKTEPGKVIRPLALGAFVTSAALLKYNAQYLDEEGRLELWHVPPDIRRDFHYWFFPDAVEQLGVSPVDEKGRRRYLRIRKGDVQALFHNVVENALLTELWRRAPEDKRVEGLEPRWGQIAVDTATAAGLPGNFAIDTKNPLSSLALSVVSQLNPAIRTPIESPLLANRNLFTQTPVETRAERGRSPELRYDQRTSPTAVVIGQVTGQSPKAIEHVGRSFLGGLSEELLGIVDPFSSEFSPQVGIERGWERFVKKPPLVSSIYRRLFPTPRDAEREKLSDAFYDRQQDLTIVSKGDLPYLLKSNPQELQSYMKRHGVEGGIGELSIMREESKALDELAQVLNQLYVALRQTEDTETQRKINRQIVQVLRDSKKLMEQMAGARKALRASIKLGKAHPGAAGTMMPSPPPGPE